MKQTVVLALALTLAGVNAQNYQYRRGLARRSVFGGDSTTNVSSGPGGRGGDSKSGRGGDGGKISGHKNGKQKNIGGNGGNTGPTNNDLNNVSAGQAAGNAAGGTVSGAITNNAGSPFQFGGGMFDSMPRNGRLTINSDNSMSRIGSGGDASVSGTNNARVGTGGDGNGNGGKLGGDQSNSGRMSSKGASSGASYAGRGGDTSTGGGNSSKGGDGRLDFSPKLAVSKRSLDRRALQLEEEYAWILQQKRDLEEQEVLMARFAAPEYEEEYLEVRSEDPEAEMFYAREAEFDDEDVFDGLTARDIYNSYLELTSDY